jgi:hypothetical protein
MLFKYHLISQADDSRRGADNDNSDDTLEDLSCILGDLWVTR